MRYAPGHKEATRQRITETAARRFRQDGLDGVGVATLMADAGLTHGGFYSHFESKQELIGLATAEAMRQTHAALAETAADAAGLEALLRRYLSISHRDHPERGCVLASLGAELARQPASVRQTVQAPLQQLLGLIEQALPAGLPPAQRRSRAQAIYALLLGSLQLARLQGDAEQSARCLDDGVAAALTLAGAAA